MTTRKTKKKRSQPKKTAIKTRRSVAKSAARRVAGKKPATKKKAVVRKKTAVKAKSGKKASSPSKTPPKKTAASKPKPTSPQRTGRESFSLDTEALELQERRSRSAGQSGDLQGLSGGEFADSESVDELLEEGNSFEAGIVSGVEDAGDEEEREIHAREIPEDDVPGEYLDKE